MEVYQFNRQSGKANQICKTFNRRHQKGTLVTYWKEIQDGEPDGTTTTRSAAWSIRGTPSVLLTGVIGPIALSNVLVIGSDPGNCDLEQCA